MKKLLVILGILLLTGCNELEEYEKLMQENDYIILDVRTESEYNESHIKGAINIPYDQITPETQIEKNKLIFVYCKSGKRSKIANDTLVNMGYTTYDLGAMSELKLEIE